MANITLKTRYIMW